MFNFLEAEIFFRLHHDTINIDIIIALIPKNGEPYDVISALYSKATVIPINYPGIPKIDDFWFDLKIGEMVPLSQIIDEKIAEVAKKFPIGVPKYEYDTMLREQLEKEFRITDLAFHISRSVGKSTLTSLKEYIFSLFDKVLGEHNDDEIITEEDVKESFDRGELLPLKYFGMTVACESNGNETLILCDKGSEKPYAMLYVENNKRLESRDIEERLKLYRELYKQAYYCSSKEIILLLDREADFFDFDNELFCSFKKEAIDYIHKQSGFNFYHDY